MVADAYLDASMKKPLPRQVQMSDITAMSLYSGQCSTNMVPRILLVSKACQHAST